MMSRVLLLIMGLHAGLVHATPLVDPTRPQNTRQAVADAAMSAPRYQLQYVAIRPSGAAAVINGARVRVGDTVDGARVESIQPGRVRLRRAGKWVDLRMQYSSIRREISR